MASARKATTLVAIGLALLVGLASLDQVACTGSALQTSAVNNTMVPKGNRILGIDVTQAQNKNYDLAFTTAQSARMQAVGPSQNWDQLGPTPRKIRT